MSVFLKNLLDRCIGCHHSKRQKQQSCHPQIVERWHFSKSQAIYKQHGKTCSQAQSLKSRYSCVFILVHCQHEVLMFKIKRIDCPYTMSKYSKYHKIIHASKFITNCSLNNIVCCSFYDSLGLQFMHKSWAVSNSSYLCNMFLCWDEWFLLFPV